MTVMLNICLRSLNSTREIAAFGGVTLAFRGSAASGGGNMIMKKKIGAAKFTASGSGKKKIGAPIAPHMVLKTSAGP